MVLSRKIQTIVCLSKLHVQSDPDLPGPDLPEPRFTGTINFPRYRKITVFEPDIPGTPIYRVKLLPPRIPVNRGPTVPPTRSEYYNAFMWKGLYSKETFCYPTVGRRPIEPSQK
eukprot:sb/3476865/